MIIKTFDQGWPLWFPLKQYEENIVTNLTKHFATNTQRVVIINSVWYTDEMHESVTSWLKNNSWDQIVLVAMLDAAIPQPDDYKEFNRPVTGIGYYPGAGHVDFWALFVDHFLQTPDNDLLLDSTKINTAYMCLNRKPHWHRQQLYNQLQSLDLISKGIVSMGGDKQAVISLAQDCEHDTLAPNAGKDCHGIPNDIASLGHLNNWCSHLINIVTETVYNINQEYFVSEKIYKPIVGCRPFLVYNTDGATLWLRSRGFETYTQDFRDISDLDLAQPDNIPKFLVVLCEQTPAYWQKKFVDLQDKILYNKFHFIDYAKQQKSIVEQGIHDNQNS